VRGRRWALTLAVVFLLGVLFGRTPARAGLAESEESLQAETVREYVDSDKQAKWEEKKEERARKSASRRGFFNKWFGKTFKGLKPGRQKHLDDQTVDTVSSFEKGE